jgi:hypothetical protein
VRSGRMSEVVVAMVMVVTLDPFQAWYQTVVILLFRPTGTGFGSLSSWYP